MLDIVQPKNSTNTRIHFTKYLCLTISNKEHDHMDWFAQDSPSIINGTLIHSQNYLSFVKFYGHLNNEKLFTSSQVVDS